MNARDQSFSELRGARTSRRATQTPRVALLVVLAVSVTTCAPAVKRDLSKIPAGQVGFDDACNLQTYFDMQETKEGTPPLAVSSTEVEGRSRTSGHTRFSFETEFQLRAIRRVLDENWKRLPEATMTAPRVEIEVLWSDRSGLRRVVTERDAELSVGAERVSLPYHVCLSELLFGEPLYRRRREILGLGPLSPIRLLKAEERGDGVARDAGAPDARADGAAPATSGGG